MGVPREEASNSNNAAFPWRYRTSLIGGLFERGDAGGDQRAQRRRQSAPIDRLLDGNEFTLCGSMD